MRFDVWCGSGLRCEDRLWDRSALWGVHLAEVSIYARVKLMSKRGVSISMKLLQEQGVVYVKVYCVTLDKLRQKAALIKSFSLVALALMWL